MVYLGLGTNAGDREANLTKAVELLEATGVKVLRRSSVYETAPQGLTDQAWFLNMAVGCETLLHPAALITELLEIERTMGRNRGADAVRWGPRLIDLDILLFNDVITQNEQLTIPHPRILERRFVLEPLLELSPDLRDPRTGRLLAEALAALQDQEVSRRSST